MRKLTSIALYFLMFLIAINFAACDDGDDDGGDVGGGGWSTTLVASGTGSGFTDHFYSGGGSVGFTVTHDSKGGFKATATATTAADSVTFLSIPIPGGGSTASIPQGNYVIEVQCDGQWDMVINGAVTKIYGGPRGKFPLSYEGADCPSNITCGTIENCSDAYYYLEECGFKNLDRDDDGVPCEILCGG